MHNITNPYSLYKGQMAMIRLPKERSEAFDEYIEIYTRWNNISYKANMLLVDLQEYSICIEFGHESVISDFNNLSEQQKLDKYSMLEAQYNELECLSNMYKNSLAELYQSLLQPEKDFVSSYMKAY